MFEAALDGEFKGLYIEGEDIAQSDPNTQHVTAALTAMECIIVQDLFLNESAKFAHVFLPGSSFLEKDGTFTNAERRISRVRKVMQPKAGYADWEITQLLANAVGYPMNYAHPSEIMDEIARLTPTFTGVSFDAPRRAGQHPVALQRARIRTARRPCTSASSCAARASSCVTEYVPTSEKVNATFPLILTTGRILSQYNVGAQTRRTENNRWHDEDRLEIHPHDAEERGIAEGDWVGIASRAGETVLRARVTERVQPGVVYTTFHFPESGANVITTDNSDWATNCPEYKVTAVQATRVSQPSEWQRRFREFSETQEALLKGASHGGASRRPDERPGIWCRWRTTSATSSAPSRCAKTRSAASSITSTSTGRAACGRSSSSTCATTAPGSMSCRRRPCSDWRHGLQDPRCPGDLRRDEIHQRRRQAVVGLETEFPEPRPHRTHDAPGPRRIR